MLIVVSLVALALNKNMVQNSFSNILFSLKNNSRCRSAECRSASVLYFFGEDPARVARRGECHAARGVGSLGPPGATLQQQLAPTMETYAYESGIIR